MCGSDVKNYKITPEDFGLSRVSFSEISGDTPKNTAKVVRKIFAGEKSAKRDLVCLNAGAALYVSGKAVDIKEGISMAEESIDSSAAKEVLEKVINLS